MARFFPERRKRVRKRLTGLGTRFGEIVDFSEDGFGLIHRGTRRPELGDIVDIILVYAGRKHRISVEVVRVEPLNVSCTDVGLKLVHASDKGRAWLKTLAEMGETIGSGPLAFVKAA